MTNLIKQLEHQGLVRGERQSEGAIHPSGWRSPGRVAEQRHAVAYVISGECCFVAMMLGCLAIEPSRIAVKRGLSYYGNYVTTGVPYAIGFGSSITLTALGLARIQSEGAMVEPFRRGVAVLLALMASVPLTPYRVDLVFDWLHMGVAAALFASGLALGGWLVLRLPDRLSRSLYVIESGAGIAIVTAQLGLHDYMIPSELVFQLATFALIVHGIRQLARP
jgi:hypothetical protein